MSFVITDFSAELQSKYLLV